ncbi:MAG: hypothetical protein QXU98_13400 [Candidatus Parvarchaeota archaeon]
MLLPAERGKIKEMKRQGMTITLISKKMHVSRPIIRKYLREMENSLIERNIDDNASESYGANSIKSVEIYTKTKIAGENEGIAVADAYMRFKDELDEEMIRKLLFLWFKYDEYLKRHKMKFGDFVEGALEKQVIFYEAAHYDQSIPRFNFNKFLKGALVVKALERL